MPSFRMPLLEFLRGHRLTIVVKCLRMFSIRSNDTKRTHAHRCYAPLRRERERERGREGEIERERERERGREGERERECEREREREAGRERGGESEREDSWIDGLTYGGTDGQIDGERERIERERERESESERKRERESEGERRRAKEKERERERELNFGVQTPLVREFLSDSRFWGQ